jgi:hypothetical protein
MINIDQLQLGKILVPINVVLLPSFASIPHQWQMMACGSKRNNKQQNSGGHSGNPIFVNSRHGL